MSACTLLFGDPHQPRLTFQKSDRRQAGEVVAAHHEAELTELVRHVALLKSEVP